MLDTNDLTMGIRQAQEDINSYYIIGYYSKNDAERRKIPPHRGEAGRIRLSAPSSISATATTPRRVWQKFNATDKERQLEEALTLGDPVSELPLALEVDYFRVAKDRYFVPISVKIPGSAVGLTQERRQPDRRSRFHRPGARCHRQADRRRARQHHRQAERGKRRQNRPAPSAIRRRTDARARNLLDLRFLARENQCGKMGTFETKFTIPDLSADQIAAPELGHLEQSEGSRERGRRLGRNRIRSCSPRTRWCRTIRKSSPASRGSFARIRPCTCISRSTIPARTRIASSPV